MLIQFSVENYLSIKDKIVLSMLAGKDSEHPEYLISDTNKNYLKSAVIYGANASGKSNVLNAFWFMVNYVLTSHNQQLHKSIDRSPFKFDKITPVQPSSFEVIFIVEGVRYAYGFSVTDKYLKRAGLDYWDEVSITYYDGIDELFAKYPSAKYWFFTTKGLKRHCDANFSEGDFLVFGKETKGLDENLLKANKEHSLRIPMLGDTRSLNLSNSVAVAVYEGLRQLDFDGFRTQGQLHNLKW